MVASRPEPEWSEDQQDLMLALHAWRKALCPKCGRPLSECTAPENEGRYTVPPPTRCHATTAVIAASRAYKDSPTTEALLYGAQLR